MCDQSAVHHKIDEAVACAQIPDAERKTVKPPVFRAPGESRRLIEQQQAVERQPA